MINNQIIQRLELNKEEKVGLLTGIIPAGAHFPNTARQVCHNFSHPKQNGLKYFSSQSRSTNRRKSFQSMLPRGKT